MFQQTIFVRLTNKNKKKWNLRRMNECVAFWHTSSQTHVHETIWNIFFEFCKQIVYLIAYHEFFLNYFRCVEMGAESCRSQRQIHQISQRVRSKWRWRQRGWQETRLQANTEGPNQEEQEAGWLRGWRGWRWEWLD